MNNEPTNAIDALAAADDATAMICYVGKSLSTPPRVMGSPYRPVYVPKYTIGWTNNVWPDDAPDSTVIRFNCGSGGSIGALTTMRFQAPLSDIVLICKTPRFAEILTDPSSIRHAWIDRRKSRQRK